VGGSNRIPPPFPPFGPDQAFDVFLRLPLVLPSEEGFGSADEQDNVCISPQASKGEGPAPFPDAPPLFSLGILRKSDALARSYSACSP